MAWRGCWAIMARTHSAGTFRSSSNAVRLQEMLQAAGQSLNWTYSLLWQLCPKQEILVFADGYYNGAIGTRRMVHKAEADCLERSQQLMELYEYLSVGETNPRPPTALSPEDLTDCEWFYLLCASFTFPPGVGLPGKAFERQKPVWLSRANEVDRRVFSRTLLAKCAQIQTVVCIPLTDGVLEFGTTDWVEEDPALIQHAKSFFTGHHSHPVHNTRPNLSEHSTSNPEASATAAQQLFHYNQYDDGDDDEGDGEVPGSDSAEVGPGDTRCGNPTDPVDHWDMVAAETTAAEEEAGEREQQMEMEEDATSSIPQNLKHCSSVIFGAATIRDQSQGDAHYSQIISAILQHNPSQTEDSVSTGRRNRHYWGSAFSSWSPRRWGPPLAMQSAGTPQWLLKHAVRELPRLHSKWRGEASQHGRNGEENNSGFWKGTAPHEGTRVNHVLAERKRREKLNERFLVLRRMLPFVTKVSDYCLYISINRLMFKTIRYQNKYITSIWHP
uniref:Transcription factor TT8 n=1 Tax=Anthurium amnicola TaxID=1678845 RepID=A0A1D1Y216_9ARAE